MQKVARIEEVWNKFSVLTYQTRGPMRFHDGVILARTWHVHFVILFAGGGFTKSMPMRLRLSGSCGMDGCGGRLQQVIQR